MRIVTDIYQALADPTRRKILDELGKREAQTLFELLGRLAMAHGITSSRQAVSQHLALLEQVGLVRTRRRGRTKVLWFDASPLREIVARWPIPRGRRTAPSRRIPKRRQSSRSRPAPRRKRTS